MGVVQILIAVAMAVAIWWLSMAVLRMLATPPPEVDPEDVVTARQDYRCSVCGTELTVTVASVTETAAPRHCREEMTAVWRP